MNHKNLTVSLTSENNERTYPTPTECGTFIKNKKGLYKANRLVSEKDILALASAITAQRFFRQSEPLTDIYQASDYFIMKLANQEREVFCVAFLDNHNKVIDCEEMFYGTINQAIVHPREVLKGVLCHNAAGVILAHNHPSGDPTPSPADISITQHLQEALKLIDVILLDHLIIGGTKIISLKKLGFI